MPNELSFSDVLHEISTHLEDSPASVRRVFHGRGRAFPGYEHLNVEWYPPFLIVQNFGETLNETERAALESFLPKHPQIKSVIEQSRQWPDFIAKIVAGDQEVTLPLLFWSDMGDDIRCEISLGKNRNTGAFLDMRAGWQWILEHASQKRVLNLFCYTGIFSLFALRGGAAHVDNVDMAANVLKIAQRNHKKNELHDGLCAFYKRDVLKSDRWFECRTPYDIIIADPPPYQKKAFRGWSDYSKLLQTCRNSLAEGGKIFACLNNPQVSIDEFQDSLTNLFPDAQGFERVQRAPEIKELDNDKGLKVIVISF